MGCTWSEGPGLIFSASSRVPTTVRAAKQGGLKGHPPKSLAFQKPSRINQASECINWASTGEGPFGVDAAAQVLGRSLDSS